MNTTVNTSKFPKVIYVGDQVDLDEDECFFIASLFWAAKGAYVLHASDRKLSIPEKRDFAFFNKMCRVIHDGDTRHPSAWPEAPIISMKTGHVLPDISIHGVTLPENYVRYMFDQMGNVSEQFLATTLMTHDQYNSLINKIRFAVA